MAARRAWLAPFISSRFPFGTACRVAAKKMKINIVRARVGASSLVLVKRLASIPHASVSFSPGSAGHG